MKNIIIISIVIACAALLWGVNLWFAPEKTPSSQREVERSQAEENIATGTEEVVPPATSSEPIIIKQPKKEPARIALTTTQFPYTITVGTTPCGDKIGSFDVVSTDLSKELYWGMTGAMPLWLTFSAVEGKTPATVDMSFNCIMSGAEEKIDWGFVVVEKTADGKYVDGYYRSFKIEGDIVRE